MPKLSLFEQWIEKTEARKHPCKGVFFRVRENAFYQNDRIVKSIEFRKPKRISCPGCEKCGWFYAEKYIA